MLDGFIEMEELVKCNFLYTDEKKE